MSRFYKRAIIWLIALFLLSNFVVTLLAQGPIANRSANWQMRQMQDQVSQLVDYFEQEAGQLEENQSEIFDQTDQIVSDDLTVFDRNKRILYSNSRADRIQVSQLQMDKMDRGEFIIDVNDRRDSNQKQISVCARVEVQGQSPFYIRLSRTEHIRSLAPAFISRYYLAFTLIFTLLFALTVKNLGGKISESLEEMKHVTTSIIDKNYDHRYRGGQVEIVDDLGYSINKLASKLEYQVQELENSNEQLNQLVSNLNIGIMLLDHQRYIKIVNPALSEFLELSLSDYIDRPYIHAVNNPWIIELVEQAYESGRPQSDEVVFKSSEDRILDTNIIPINSSEDASLDLIVIFYDITEIRRLEKVRTDFVANASHELRTPVTALKGFTETLLDGAMEDRETLIYFLQIMQEESERLDSIVGDILQLSRLEQTADRRNIEEISVQKTVRTVFEVLKQKAESKSVDLQMDVADNFYIYFEEDNLKQILLNLVNNGILYNSPGGSVKVSASQEGNQVKLEIEDDGLGIQESEQKRIFERFYRVDKARSRNSGGTGLGLSIVRHLVENSGGRIILESKYKVGSKFTVYLPMIKPS